jgi:hypothetical protein
MEEIVLSSRKVPYQIIRKTIKNSYLRIKPQGFLQITTNRRTSVSGIEEFIRKNEPRILVELDRLQVKSPVNPGMVLIFGRETPCVRENSNAKKAFFQNGVLTIPNKEPQKAKKMMEDFYGALVIEECQKMLSQKGETLSNYFSLERLVLKTQRMKSQFGSCQAKKRIIKLNSVLGRFDKKYLEAIFLHELVHLKVANHGADFYRLLISLVPQYRLLRKELNQLAKTTEV